MLARQVLQSSLRASARSGLRPSLCQSRFYAQAASSQDSAPPIALYGVDGTYASALYTAAAKNSSLEPTSRALNSLGDMLKRDVKLSGVLATPTLTDGDKSQIIQELQKHTGGQDKEGTVKNFLQALADNNRLGILEAICNKFAALMGASRGEVEMTVTSATKLDQRILQRLESAVSKSEYSQGKTLKVVPKVDPDLVGGVVVEIGDRTIDMSVSSKIAKMNKLLTDTL